VHTVAALLIQPNGSSNVWNHVGLPIEITAQKLQEIKKAVADLGGYGR